MVSKNYSLIWLALLLAVLCMAPYYPGGGGSSSGVYAEKFDFMGTLVGSLIAATTCVYTETFPATLASPSSQVSCGINPGQTDTYTVLVAGASKGTFTINSSCVPSFSGIASGFTCTAGQRLEIDGPTSFSVTAPSDVAISLAYSR